MNFGKYSNVTEIVIPEKVQLINTDSAKMFYNMRNLRVANIAFENNVTNMSHTYYDCYNLYGNPVCGKNVTNMAHAYQRCHNLTGSPVCGQNVTNMEFAYQNCRNLTGNPVCGQSVTNMEYAYSGCYNLYGSPVCGNNVINMLYAYYNCSNLYGNAYFYSNSVRNFTNCFYGRSNSRRLNIYVHAGTTTNTCLMNTGSYGTLTGTQISSWANVYATNGYYYHKPANIYIYPVANVAAAKEANGD